MSDSPPIVFGDEFWIRHLRTGAYASTAILVAGGIYVGSGSTPIPPAIAVAIIGVATLMTVLSPILPWPRLVNKPWWTMVMTIWSLVLLGLVGISTYLDGGLSGPLMITTPVIITFAAMAYPPRTVTAMTVVASALPIIVGYASGDPPGAILFITVIIATLGILSRVVAGNHRRSYQELVDLHRKIENLAFEDALTGCRNHRSFHEELGRMLGEATDGDTRLALVLIDIDFFKQVNDTYGHPTGDRLLAAIGSTLRSTTRSDDVVARIGGEEFAVLSTMTDPTRAAELGERIRLAIAQIEEPLRVTASLGVAIYPDSAPDPEALIETADRLLYAAKRRGRNQVVTIAEARTPERALQDRAVPARERHQPGFGARWRALRIDDHPWAASADRTGE
ncbi:MAG: GGDEF domain-containing protein [Acidimicrobiales bacterium]